MAKFNTQSGFTIVELLIVIVVIAILAAITIVSYNGITARANSTSSKSTASTFMKKAEAFRAEEGRYPTYQSDLNESMDTTVRNKPYYLPANSVVYLSATPTSSSKNNGLYVQRCGASSATQYLGDGIRVTYYKYDSPAGTLVMTAGNTTSCESFAMPDMPD